MTKEASDTVLSVFIFACISVHFGNFKDSERIFIKCGTIIVILQETSPLYFCSALYTIYQHDGRIGFRFLHLSVAWYGMLQFRATLGFLRMFTFVTWRFYVFFRSGYIINLPKFCSHFYIKNKVVWWLSSAVFGQSNIHQLGGRAIGGSWTTHPMEHT